MISATQLRPGMVIKFNNELYSVFSMNHRTPGNLRGFVQARMRSLRIRLHDRAPLLFRRPRRKGRNSMSRKWSTCTTTASTTIS